MYWLTRSQQFHLMKHISETLAGRIAILNLQGFSQQERFGVSIKNVFLDTSDVLQQELLQITLIDLYKAIWERVMSKIGMFP